MEITLTFLTPAFLYGADRTKPEFRIPSLIGQMRYWWRMTQDWSDVKSLREREAEIFGLGDLGAKSFYIYLTKKPLFQSSPSVRRLRNNGEQDRDRDGTPLFQFTSQNNGISYFFYPFMRHKGTFSWLPDMKPFHLSIDFSSSASEEIEKSALLAIFLTARFGGLGSRSRRGAGAIEVAGSDLFNLTEKHLEKYITSADKNSLPGAPYFRLIEQNSPLFRALSKPNIRFKQSWV